MPIDAALIFNDNPGAIPASYRVPPGQELILQAITAEWNGTGASGAFLASLAVYSQDGVLISRVFPETQLAAGDLAEVTYAPFLRDEQEAGGAAPDVAYYLTTTLTHAGGGLQNYTMQLESTSNSGVFGISGALAQVQAGAYTVVGRLNLTTNVEFSTATTDEVVFAMTFPAFPFYTLGYIGDRRPYDAADPIRVGTMEFVGNIVCDVATTMRLNVDISDGVARSFDDLTLYIEKVRDFDWTF